jgi:putative nucleotidyltransferase with HDIG domain
MKEVGLLELFIPELLEGENITQPKYHEYDVFDHALYTLDLAEDSIKWAALLHDIGKSRTKQVTRDGEHFYRHDEVGAQMTGVILKRLRFPNAEVSRIKRLIRWHMFFFPEDEEALVRRGEEISEKELKANRSREKLHKWSDSAIRRFVRNVGGEDAVEDLIRLRIADSSSNPKSSFDPDEISRLSERISQVRKNEMAITLNDLDISGYDLSELGIANGPQMKEILEMLLDEVIEDPMANKKELLVMKAKEIIKTMRDKNSY